MRLSRVLRLLATLWSVEGPRSVCDRLLDRFHEEARRRRFRRVRTGAPLGVSSPVVILSAAPPSPRFGGVQAQLLTRLRAMEARGQPYAILYPETRRSFRLEASAGGVRRCTFIPGAAAVSPPALADRELRNVALRALDLARASVLHLEGLGPLAPGALLGGERSFRLVLSLHDFALFCPRPHLLERPWSRFCEYCRDLPRCAECLRVDWPVPEGFQAERRRIAGELLRSADALVFPSTFLQAAHQRLFPRLPAGRMRVLEPPATGPVLGRLGRPQAGNRLHVGFVGGARPHKGSQVLEDLIRGLPPGERASFRWTVLGGGEPEVLSRLRRLPHVRVRGYYRYGALPRLLERLEVHVVLILSIVPESYSLALTEAVRARVPVIAFDRGAIGERIRRFGGGVLVPPEDGPDGIREALLSLHKRRGEPISADTGALGTHGDAVAREMEALYQELLAEPSAG